MALEAVSAVGLAANILQFLEFSFNLIADTREIYHSAKGVTTRNVELESIAESLSRLSLCLMEPVTRTGVALSEAELEIIRHAICCKIVADELLTTVRSLQIRPGSHRKWQSFRQALDTVCKKDKISQLQKRLENARAQLTVHVLSLMR